MNDTIICKRCNEICQIDGEFPKFSAWCDNCRDYVNVEDYTVDYHTGLIDRAYERSKWER